MQSDLPHTIFKKMEDRDPKKKTKASDEVLRLQEEANRQMQERKEKESAAKKEKVYDIEELYK